MPRHTPLDRMRFAVGDFGPVPTFDPDGLTLAETAAARPPWTSETLAGLHRFTLEVIAMRFQIAGQRQVVVPVNTGRPPMDGLPLLDAGEVIAERPKWTVLTLYELWATFEPGKAGGRMTADQRAVLPTRPERMAARAVRPWKRGRR